MTGVESATILIIDDDDDLISAIRPPLEQANYRVVRACDGQAGVEMARTNRPDLILLDWMMPVKNGFEACAELRKMGHLDRVPILVMTAFGQDVGEIYGVRKGDAGVHIHDYLEKPLEINVLLQRIAQALASPGTAQA